MKIKKTLFIYLSLAFFVCVIVGTVTHEMGHYAAGRYYGYSAKLSYGSVSYKRKISDSLFYDSLRLRKIRAEDYKSYRPRLYQMQWQSLWKTLGGPLVNMGIGTIGFILLCIFFRKQKVSSAKGWALVLLTFFWSRQLAYLFRIPYLLLFVPDYPRGYANTSDEIKISANLGLHIYTMGWLTGAIAAIIIGYTAYKFIKREDYLTVFLSGIAGCGLGVLVWFFLLGPVILP